MTIGAAWNIDDPSKPYTEFDVNADLRIPFGFAEWLADLGVGYGSHEVIAPSPLECVEPGSYVADVTLVRMRVLSGATYTLGVKYPFTIRIHGDDGTTRDDRTLYLKLRQR